MSQNAGAANVQSDLLQSQGGHLDAVSEDETADDLGDDVHENRDEDSDIEDLESSHTWESDGMEEEDNTVTHDNNFGEGDEEAWADDEYWDEDAAADAWLARNPGGGRLLYPRLLIIRASNGSKDVITSRQDAQNPCYLLGLPREIRNLVYSHFFDPTENLPTRPGEDYAPFPVHDSQRLTRVHLASEDLELKFWLSSGLLQTSRQIRYEALPLFLGTRVFTTDYLKVIPRFADFLGPAGCTMVRYMDLWDHDNMQMWHHPRYARECPLESLQYQAVISSLQKFPRLQHLRLVLSRSARSHNLPWNDPWYTSTELEQYGHPRIALKANIKPKMLNGNLGEWPECDLLKQISAKGFTLAFDVAGDNCLVDFDSTSGVLPDLITLMRANYDGQHERAQASSAASLQGSDLCLPEVTELAVGRSASEAMPSAWQDTDDLEDKTIRLYNFLRQFLSFHSVDGDDPIYECFPFALPSTGAIMRDCPSCYALGAHCGCHGIPYQHITNEHATQFQHLSYADLMQAASELIDDVRSSSNVDFFARDLILQRYFGWPEQPALARLQSLDAAVVSGWEGKNIDKEEVKVWDAVFYKVYTRFLGDGSEWLAP